MEVVVKEKGINKIKNYVNYVDCNFVDKYKQQTKNVTLHVRYSGP